MPADFRDAGERHWHDADYLYSGSRFANADHLFGFAAECALKSVMQALGMPLSPGGVPLESQHKTHVNNLWNEFISFANSRGGARYATPLTGIANPFSDWRVDSRYYHRDDFSLAVVAQHRQAAHETLLVLRAAVLDGTVS